MEARRLPVFSLTVASAWLLVSALPPQELLFLSVLIRALRLSMVYVHHSSSGHDTARRPPLVPDWNCSADGEKRSGIMKVLSSGSDVSCPTR